MQQELITGSRNYSENTPHSIRHRLSAHKQPAPMGIMPSFRQDGPSSPLAVSTKSGRQAHGPWSGPFGASASHGFTASESPLYMDLAGRAFFSLSHDRALAAKHAQPPHSPTAGIALRMRDAAAAQALVQAAPLVPKAQLGLEKRAHSKEMALLLGKPLPKYNNQAGSLTTPRSRRRNGSLMQPRQGF